MTRANIINEVLLRMDEKSPLDGIAIVPNGIVGTLLNEAAKNILLTCPLALCPLTNFDDGAVSTTNNGDVYIQRVVLPTNFLRIIRFRLSGWQTSVSTVTEEGSHKHLSQFYKYLNGGENRPVIVVVKSVTAGISLEYYPLSTTPTIEEAACVISLLPENMPDNLLTPLYWYAAASAFQTFGMADQMTACMGKVQEYYKLFGYGN